MHLKLVTLPQYQDMGRELTCDVQKIRKAKIKNKRFATAEEE